MANDNSNERVEEIDLLKLGKALWRRLWVLVICTIIGGAAALSYAYFLIVPSYTASALIYVNNSVSLGNTKVGISNGDLVASSGLIDTYGVILKSRNTLEEVIRLGGLPYTYEQLKPMISSGAVNNTSVFQISVTNHQPDMAAHITNTLADVLSERIVKIVEGSSVEIVDYAVPPSHRSAPSFTKYTMIGALLGLVISTAIVTLRFLMDSTIREEEYLLENYKDIPILTVIPNLEEDSSSGYHYGYGKSSPSGSANGQRNGGAR